ncbi:MAG: pyruvate formate lyase family protein [Clostridia bacterium]
MKVSEMMKNDFAMSPFARFLQKNGMKTASVFYKNMNESMMRRASRAVRFLLEETETPTYRNGQVVFLNSDFKPRLVSVNESDCLRLLITGEILVKEDEYQKIPTESDYEEQIKKTILENTKNARSMKCIMRYVNLGNHTSMNFEYVLKYGFNGYRQMISKKLDELKDTDDYYAIEFQESMLDIMIGMEDYIDRYKKYLKSIKNPDDKLKRLISALEIVPFNPPRDFYEAYIMMGIAMFFGESQEPNRIDQLLLPFYENDDKVNREEALFLIREMFVDINERMHHPGTTHVTIGGSYADGTAVYNELTELCVIAIRALRSPNVSLCMREDMPQKLWDEYMYNISKGYTQPALVNDKLYVEGFVNKYNMPREDAVKYVFGGCSEIMIQGKTSCDAIWAGYNMLDILEDTMYNNLLCCNTFEEFYELYKKHLKITIKEMEQQNNMRQTDFSLHYTYPFRTLLVDGCIDSSTAFTAGGAKYNFTCAAIFGASNTFNAMYAIKKLYSGELGNISKEDFLKCFANNYKGYEELYTKICDLDKFGNYNEELNDMAHDLMTKVFGEIKTLRGSRANSFYIPTMIFWTTWIEMGKIVGATPDGRFAYQPLADSIGATQGTDKEGPTTALGSALSIPQEECVGTAVYNLFLDGSNFETEEKLQKTQTLIKTYMLEGGCQVQVNVVDRKLLEDALIHPEKHEDIIVRVGGFSDNFIYLSDEIKKQVMNRNHL